MIDFKFNESKHICDVVEQKNTVGMSIHKVMWCAVLYYSKINIVGKDNLFDTAVNFMKSVYNDFMYEQYVSSINNCINKSKKYSIKNIESITITKSELDKIKSLNDVKKEKIAFVLLAIAKYFNALGNNDRDCLYIKTSEIFKYARVAIPSSERDLYLSFAYDEGILSPNYSIGYNALTVSFVSHDENDKDELILDEYDYKELVYAYLNYKNGGYKRCRECNRWFKMVKGKPGMAYCHLHKREKSSGTKAVECIDCGKTFEVDARNNTKCRCDECQGRYSKEYHKNYMKNVRSQ